MDAECARMNCEERATVLMAYDPRNARAWLRDLTDAHPSLGLSLCSWHAASTSVPMGWECIDERRGMRFGLDDVDEPEAGFLFTEETISTKRLLTEPSSLDADGESSSDAPGLLASSSTDVPLVTSRSGSTEPSVDDPVVAEPYVTRFDDRGRFDDTDRTPQSVVPHSIPDLDDETDLELDSDAATDSYSATDTETVVPEPEPVVSWSDDADEPEDADTTVEPEPAAADSGLPDPEPIRILDRDAGRAPSVSYFDDDGYSEPIAIPLDEIDGIELGFEPLMAGEELNDLKLEAAERFTVIEPVADDEFEDFEPVPEPIVDSVPIDPVPMTQTAAALDTPAEGEYLLTPDLELDSDADEAETGPRLVAVDASTAAPIDAPPADAESDDLPLDDALEAPQGFSAEFLAAEPVDEPPVWADDEPSWRSEPAATEPTPAPATAADDDPAESARPEIDDAFELPRLFDDIGYAQIDDDDRAEPNEAPADEEEIDPADELSFDDIFPSMVNRPPTQPAPQPDPAPAPRPDVDGGYGDPSASMTQPKLPTIDADVPQLPERRERTHGGPEQLRPPVARGRHPEPSFEHLVFREDPSDVEAPTSTTGPGTPAMPPTNAPSAPSTAPLPRLFENNNVEVRQLSVDASTPLLNRAFGFVQRD